MKTEAPSLHTLYLRRLRKREWFVRFMRIFVLLFVVTLWEVGARIGWFDPFIMSSPSRVIDTIARLYNEGSLLGHIGITLYETVMGFLLGTGIGVLIAIVLWWLPLVNRILDPYLVVLNALPKIALGPILIVWIGAGRASIIVMAVLISFVVTAVTVLAGFMETTDEKQLLMRTLGANKWQIFQKVVLPASVPNLISALKISVGMSWVGVIVGEYLVSQAGLGYLIVYGGQVFKLDLVMASIVVLCVLAALMYYAVALIEKRVRR
ncbi:MAG: ABC transporter permease [Eubacteriales bacterium]|nr:ABC transporter permease [Eubacteriales bacterium]